MSSVDSAKPQPKVSLHPQTEVVWVDERNRHDVLKGKGNGVNNWPGNVKFREIVNTYKPAYIAAHRSQRPRYSFLVVDQIKNLSPPGRFLKLDVETKRWYEIDEREALEKARQALSEKPRNIDVRATRVRPLNKDGNNEDGDNGHYNFDSINTKEIMSILDGVSSKFEQGGGSEGEMVKSVEVSVENSWDTMKTRDVDAAYPMSSGAMSLLSDMTSKMDLNETGMNEIVAAMARFNEGESIMSLMSLSSMFSPEKHREQLGIGRSGNVVDSKNAPPSSLGGGRGPPQQIASSSLPDGKTSLHGPKTVEAPARSGMILDSVSTFQPEDSFGDSASFGPDLFQLCEPDGNADVI